MSKKNNKNTTFIPTEPIGVGEILENQAPPSVEPLFEVPNLSWPQAAGRQDEFIDHTPVITNAQGVKANLAIKHGAETEATAANVSKPEVNQPGLTRKQKFVIGIAGAGVALAGVGLPISWANKANEQEKRGNWMLNEWVEGQQTEPSSETTEPTNKANEQLNQTLETMHEQGVWSEGNPGD